MDKNIEKKGSKKWLWLLLVLFILFWWGWRSVNSKKTGTSMNTTATKYAPCTKTANDSPAMPESWDGWLYSAPIATESSNLGTPDSGKRDFSLSEMINKSGHSVFFRLQRTGFAQKDYVTGVKAVIEVCDENNQTNEFYSATNKGLKPSGEKISATVMHLHNNPKIFKSGTYRIDALMNINGEWVLVKRLDGVRLRE